MGRITALDFNAICRICIQFYEKENVSPIFTQDTQDGKISVPEKIKYCSAVVVAEDDGLPLHICNNCMSKLNQSFIFRNQCVLADITLKRLKHVRFTSSLIINFLKVDVENQIILRGNDEFFKELGVENVEDEYKDGLKIDEFDNSKNGRHKRSIHTLQRISLQETKKLIRETEESQESNEDSLEEESLEKNEKNLEYRRQNRDEENLEDRKQDNDEEKLEDKKQDRDEENLEDSKQDRDEENMEDRKPDRNEENVMRGEKRVQDFSPSMNLRRTRRKINNTPYEDTSKHKEDMEDIKEVKKLKKSIAPVNDTNIVQDLNMDTQNEFFTAKQNFSIDDLNWASEKKPDSVEINNAFSKVAEEEKSLDLNEKNLLDSKKEKSLDSTEEKLVDSKDQRSVSKEPKSVSKEHKSFDSRDHKSDSKEQKTSYSKEHKSFNSRDHKSDSKEQKSLDYKKEKLFDSKDQKVLDSKEPKSHSKEQKSYSKEQKILDSKKERLLETKECKPYLKEQKSDSKEQKMLHSKEHKSYDFRDQKSDSKEHKSYDSRDQKSDSKEQKSNSSSKEQKTYDFRYQKSDSKSSSKDQKSLDSKKQNSLNSKEQKSLDSKGKSDSKEKKSDSKEGKSDPKEKKSDSKKRKSESEEEKSNDEDSKPVRSFPPKRNFTYRRPTSFKCKHCDKVYPSEGGWKYHLTITHNENYEPFVCEHCGQTFKVKKNLEAHKNSIHYQLKLHACDLCDRSFASKYALKIHILWHKDEKNFTCEVCGLRFRTVTKMNIHKKSSHMEHKQHVCEICCRGFRWKRDYQVHMRIHTGEKPYSCSVCNRKFAAHTNMRKHERLHYRVEEESIPQSESSESSGADDPDSCTDIPLK